MNEESHEDPQLSFATTDELCHELLRRSTNAAIVLESEPKGDSSALVPEYWYKGGWSAALGLADRIHIHLRMKCSNAEIMGGIEDLDDDDGGEVA